MGSAFMLMRYCLGLAFLLAASVLTLWGMWSDHMLGRGWMTGLAFAGVTIGAAITGAVFLGSAVADQTEQ
jgi:hypothetical protein